MPNTSIAEAMVLAVYMPPQAPAPGQEWRTISLRSCFVDVAGEKFAIALERGNDVELFVVRSAARPDGAAVDHQRRGG